MSKAFINFISTSVPPHDVHQRFSAIAPGMLKDLRLRKLFTRMSERSHIEHRYSYLSPGDGGINLDGEGFYKTGNFPDTAKRMRFYEKYAFQLAQKALDQLDLKKAHKDITHVIVTSCTGFYAPGLDLQIIEHYGLNVRTERTIIGFMGCYAAFNGMKLAHHIVRSEPTAKVLIVNLELCTLHLQETENIEELLSYLIFADGCAAAIVSSEAAGLSLESFNTSIIEESAKQITWAIGNSGFDMVLSGKVPTTIVNALPKIKNSILGKKKIEDIVYWAIHPGGRTILEAVQKSLELDEDHMRLSRKTLRDFGNMSSATIMFVLKDILEASQNAGTGCAMAFGPGVTVESMIFNKV